MKRIFYFDIFSWLQNTRFKNYLIALMAIIFILSICYNVISLKYNTVNVDEAWSTSSVLNNWDFETGAKFKMFEEDPRWKSKTIAYYLPLSISYFFFGYSPFSVRLVSLFYGYLTIVTIFFLVKHLYGKKAAIVSSLFLFSYMPFIYIIQFGRRDSTATFFLTLSILIFFMILTNYQGDKWAFLLPISAGMAVSTHPNSIIIFPICLFTALFYIERSRWKAILPSLTIGIILISPLMLWQYSSFFQKYSSSSDIIVMPLMRGFDGIIESAKIKFSLFYPNLISGPRGLFLYSIFFLASIGAAIFEKRFRMFYIICWISLFFFYIFIYYSTINNSMIYLYPFIAIAISAMVYKIYKLRLPVIIIILLIPICAGLLYQSSSALIYLPKIIKDNNYSAYQKITMKMKESIPPGKKIMGQPTWFFAFQDHPYVSDRFIACVIKQKDPELYKKYGRSFREIIRNTGTEYIIMDLQLKERMKHPNSRNALPQGEVQDFLFEEAVLIAKFRDDIYKKYMTNEDTTVDIYQIMSKD